MQPVLPKHPSSEEYAQMVTDAKSHLPGLSEREIRYRSARIRYVVGGAGPPVVLVHGLGGAASNWRLIAPALAQEFRVLVPELPGHGGSSPLPAAPTLDPYADAVLAVLEAEDALPAAWIGHSLGGLVGLRAALRRPEAVSGIVLAAAAGISSATRSGRAVVALIGRAQPGRVVAPYRRRLSRSRAGRTLTFGWWGVADPAGLEPEMAEAFLAGPGEHTDTRSAGRALVDGDPRAELGSVRCPCLCLWGANDNWVPLGDGMEYARRLRAPLRSIAGCGHLLIGERPDAVLRAVREFLGSLPPSS
jgi:pimeloyl-ACP methyl ester carboxylesterase